MVSPTAPKVVGSAVISSVRAGAGVVSSGAPAVMVSVLVALGAIGLIGTLLANQADLFSIRADVEGETSMAGLTKQLGDSLKPIPIGTGLLVYLDQSKRLEFLKQWQQAIKR